MKTVTTNWLSVIRAKQIKEKNLKTAQLCMAGYCVKSK